MNELLARIWAHADARPAAEALVDRGHVTRYGALRHAVQTRADVLGAAPGDLVATLEPRGASRIITLLSAWHSGAAVLPLDPRWPAARVEAVVHDARVSVLVDGAGASSRHAASRPEHSELAYMVYTSGSGGRPKGVRVGPGGLPSMVSAQIGAFGLTERSRALFMLGLGFDASFSDLLTTLVAGGALVIEDEDATAPVALPDTLRAHRVTHADVPPCFLPRLAPDTLPACLETIIIGGEAPPSAAVRAHAARRRLVNVYGPSEATICTSLVRCGDDWDAPLIGAPLPGVRYRLEGDPLAPELLIGGPQLALGYTDEALTRERFVMREGDHYYRSGDLVRKTPEGLAFVGRRDRQVKLRGQLVAPEEVEAALGAITGVRDARVFVAGGQLMAEVARASCELSAAEVLSALRVALPPYAVPSAVSFADEVPRGAHHKRISVAGDDPAVLPLLLTALREVLGRPVGPDDDVYAAGADSLVLLDLTARLAGLGLRVPADRWPRHRRARTVARHLDTTCDVMPLAGLEPGRVDTSAWRRRNPDATPRRILVTGATGALGRALLPSLLAHAERVDGEVVALVRAHDDATALGRLTPHPALEVVRGDLGERRFGWSETRYDALAERLDTVVHLGARVDGLLPLEVLSETNSAGTRRLISFCNERAPKRLLHASTLALFTSTRPRVHGRCAPGHAWEGASMVGGYAQSKWLAERLVRRADPDGRWATVVRFGLLVGRDDHLSRALRGLVGLGAGPVLPDGARDRWRVDVCPITWAARAAWALFTDDVKAARHRVHHLSGLRGATLGELLDGLVSEGVRLRFGAPSELFEAMLHSGDPDTKVAVMSMLRALDPTLHAGLPGLDLFQSTDLSFAAPHTEDTLRRLGVDRPDEARVVRELVRAVVRAHDRAGVSVAECRP